MKFKPFDKNFTITPHVIDQQLASWRNKMKAIANAHEQPWVDTLPMDKAEAEERLATHKDKLQNLKGKIRA